MSTLVAANVHADGTADEADLQFQLGKELYKKGDYENALAHFFQSNRLVDNRNVLFNIAGAYEALGRYADAFRYYIDALAGETNAQKRADAESALLRLAPQIAVLDVQTEPPGATLYIQRKDLGSVGQAPRPLALEPGKYHVIAELPGYEPQESPEVEITKGKRATIKLTLPQIVGTLHIEMQDGKKAMVRVDREDDAPACTTPCDISLVPGRHELYFTADGYQAAPRAVIVEAKKTLSISQQLASLRGTIVVRTDEAKAAVFVDGKPVGFTPLVARDISVGKRTIRIERHGYKPLVKVIEVRSDQQEELTNISLDPIDEGVALREVTAASRTAENVDDAPSSVTVIDRYELSAFGYPTIYEAVRGVRGIALSNDRAYPTASVRGIGQPGDYGNRFLVLSNGASLNENIGASSFLGQEARADLCDVERIEVVRGPGSLLYGTGAISGVLNLVLHQPDAPNEVHAGLGVYDDNVGHARAGFHYNFSKTRSVWASVSAARSDGFDLGVPIDSEASKTLPIAHHTDAFATIGTAGQVTFDSVSAQWFYHQRHQVVPVGAYGATFDDPTTTLDEQRFMGELRYDPRLTKTTKLFTRVFANYYNAPAVYSIDGARYDESYAGLWYGAEARLMVTPKPWLRLTAGAEAQLHTLARMVGTSEFDGKTEQYLNEERPYSFGAAYAIAEGAPKQWFRFSAGIRANAYSNLGAFVVPRIALIFKPGPTHTLKLMGGRAFRAPSVYERYYDDGGATQLRADDPARGLSLSPEISYSGEVEYSTRFRPDWLALIAAHNTLVERIIGLSPDSPGSEIVRYENGNVPVVVVGADLELRREWRRGFMLTASYGVQRAWKLDDTLKNPVLENVPTHLGSFRVVAPFIEDYASLGFRGTLEAPRRIRADSDDTTQPALVADITISGKVTNLGVRYVIGLYNLADWHYSVPIDGTFLSRTMPQNGRRFLLDIQWAYR